jgi:energy-converting hydrogenase Eha subunit F
MIFVENCQTANIVESGANDYLKIPKTVVDDSKNRLYKEAYNLFFKGYKMSEVVNMVKNDPVYFGVKVSASPDGGMRNRVYVRVLSPDTVTKILKMAFIKVSAVL